jgi:outer membrane protein
MMGFKKVLLLIIATNLMAYYKYDDPSLGKLTIEGMVWQTQIGGDIIGKDVQNDPKKTSLKNELGFDKTTVLSSLGVDLRSDYSWIPNVYVNYFAFDGTAHGVMESNVIGAQSLELNGSVYSTMKYTELNTILYGYLRQSIMEFNLGINLKKINYEQTIKEADSSDTYDVKIVGPDKIIPIPYIALKVDLGMIDTVLKAEASILSIGDDEASDFRYSINYRAMRNLYISYGYRKHLFKSSSVDNPHEKYEVDISGNYIAAKILF